MSAGSTSKPAKSMFTSSGGTRGAALLGTERPGAPDGAGGGCQQPPPPVSLRHELVQGEHRRACGTEPGQRACQAQDEGARQDAGEQNDRPALGQGLGVIGICHVLFSLKESSSRRPRLNPGAVRVCANDVTAEPALSGPKVHGEGPGSPFVGT